MKKSARKITVAKELGGNGRIREVLSNDGNHVENDNHSHSVPVALSAQEECVNSNPSGRMGMNHSKPIVQTSRVHPPTVQGDQNGNVSQSVNVSHNGADHQGNENQQAGVSAEPDVKDHLLRDDHSGSVLHPGGNHVNGDKHYRPVPATTDQGDQSQDVLHLDDVSLHGADHISNDLHPINVGPVKKQRKNHTRFVKQEHDVLPTMGDHSGVEKQRSYVAHDDAVNRQSLDYQLKSVHGNGGGNHFGREEHSVDVSSFDDNGHVYTNGTLSVPDELPILVQKIVELWKRKTAWHRAEKSLTLQIKAFCRRLCSSDIEHETRAELQRDADALYKAICGKGEHRHLDVGRLATLPFFPARTVLEDARLAVEKQGRELAKGLPAADFCEQTPGLSSFTLFALVGECPGINYRGLLDFPTYQKLWTRCGIGLLKDGTRQRLLSGADAILAKYSPARRSTIWTIGDSLVKSQGPYRELYLQLKVKEIEKAEAKGLTVLPSAKIPKKEAEQYISEGHIHNRAKRWMEKYLVKHLWQMWRRETVESVNINTPVFPVSLNDSEPMDT